MSDDTDSNVVHLPARGSDSGAIPDAPDAGDFFYSEPPDSGAGDGVPPESPEETTMELPPIRTPISPEMALRETGMPDTPDEPDDEGEQGDYVQPRSLADRLGDWLEFRLEVARDRHAGEASFREAEIARKAALVKARTAREVAMMEQNGKLHAAMMKAKGDKAAARGKADADRTRSSGSGLGADKGRSKAGGGGGSSRQGGGTNSSGSGRGSGGGNSPKGTGKGSDRSSGGRNSGAKGKESAGGSKGRQNSASGSGSGKGKDSGSGKGNSGKGSGSGNSGTGKGGSKGDRRNKTSNSSASSPRTERSRGRQERAAARQAARQQRRSAAQAAGLADRSKDRDQDRAARQVAREERRAAKAERKAKREKKREAAKDDRTTLGAAVTEEAQRRWDERRTAAEKDKAAKNDKTKGDKVKDGTGDKDSEATSEKTPEDDLNPPSDKESEDGKKSGEKPSDASSDEEDPKAATGSDDGPGTDDVKDPPDTDDSDDGRSFTEWLRDWFTSVFDEDIAPEPEEPTMLRPEDLGVTVDRPDQQTGPKPDGPDEDDIPDAVIVDDPTDPFGARVTKSASLPRAPEPHTQRPGTTRPDPQESPVTEVNKKTATGQARMAAKHRTDITFGEYLMEIVNIAIAAGLDRERAQDLAVALRKVADALRDMATDLVGDHNIATVVVDQISDLADAAGRMKLLAERCATECEVASEAARIAAVAVGSTYGQDLQAMRDAGLAHASAAAHHD